MSGFKFPEDERIVSYETLTLIEVHDNKLIYEAPDSDFIVGQVVVNTYNFGKTKNNIPPHLIVAISWYGLK